MELMILVTPLHDVGAVFVAAARVEFSLQNAVQGDVGDPSYWVKFFPFLTIVFIAAAVPGTITRFPHWWRTRKACTP